MTTVEPFGATAGGLPYPEPSAPANLGAGDIKALAQALEARGHGLLVQSGETAVTFNSAAGALTWPTPFKAGTVPRVIAAGGTGSAPNNTLALVGTENASATGVLLHAIRVSGTGAASAWVTGGAVMNVVWFAIGVAP